MSAKYDRQLRLWASTGQANLEECHVCLINATSTGSELLKNLILPGIGQFTIIDNGEITHQDIAANFFLTQNELGQSRATIMAQYLGELNADTAGHAITLAVEDLNDEIWDQFSVVAISDYIPTKSLNHIKSILFKKQIPLLIVNTVGYYGTVHLVTPEITVVETHGNKLYDLRIDKPWPQLFEYAHTFDLDSLDDTDHAHVPAVVIFILGLEKWMKINQTDTIPKKSKEKALFKAFIELMSRNIGFETNFIEAVNTIHRVYRRTEVPPYLQSFFTKVRNVRLTGSTPFFWILIKALDQFVEKYNCIPLAGSLPDMASDTKNYITLQNIYRDKAALDREKLLQEINKITQEIMGRTVNSVESDLVNIFCKNLQNLHVTEGSEKVSSPQLINQMINESSNEYDDATFNTLAIYYGILARASYIDEYGKVPAQDFEGFVQCFCQMIGKKELPTSILNTLQELNVHDVTNYHNLSSLIGGIASQEILKLCTSQYIPLDNMLVFDGIRSISSKYKIN